ncbi:COP9 signalosome complex subunit 3 [Gryganskiella cystojenkinii]|nr:COP9 signalosome complex subunit 3 [Gryganskiella cystojenkinii]
MAPGDPSFDAIISRIQSSTDLAVLKTFLNDMNDQVFTAKAFTPADPIEAISPSEHSLAYLYFMLYRCKASHGFHPALMEKLWTFVSTCDGAQIPLSFAEALVKIATESHQPVVAIRPLATFIQRIQSSPGQLTMLHPLLAKTCLLAQSFKDILPILDSDITDVDPRETNINYKDILLHHYYGGMIYAYHKNFERALEFFRLAVSAPADVTSAIQIESYKKYVLTSLLHHGKVLPLPKYTATPVVKALKLHCSAYSDFAAAYEKKSNTAIKTELEKIKSQLVKDRTYGLAKQCMEALHRRNIQDLTRTYLTLSIEDITSVIGLGADPEGPKYVEGIIVQMIDSGAIFARISHEHEGGMVSFLDDPNQHNNTVTMDKINSQIQNATNITAKLAAMDQKISIMPEYLSKGRHGHAADFGGYPMDESDFGLQMGYENYVDEGSLLFCDMLKASSTRSKRQRRNDGRVSPRGQSGRSAGQEPEVTSGPEAELVVDYGPGPEQEEDEHEQGLEASD